MCLVVIWFVGGEIFDGDVENIKVFDKEFCEKFFEFVV